MVEVLFGNDPNMILNIIFVVSILAIGLTTLMIFAFKKSQNQIIKSMTYLDRKIDFATIKAVASKNPDYEKLLKQKEEIDKKIKSYENKENME